MTDSYPRNTNETNDRGQVDTAGLGYDSEEELAELRKAYKSLAQHHVVVEREVIALREEIARMKLRTTQA